MVGEAQGEDDPVKYENPMASAVEEFIGRCFNAISNAEDLPERAEDFACSIIAKLESMSEWAANRKVVTENMWNALRNIEDGIARWNER